MTGSRTPSSAQPGATFTARFAAACALHADRTAVQDQSTRLTYRQLAERAARVAAAVRAGSEPGEPVAVLCGDDVHVAVGVLGVLSAGRAVAPLDQGHPDARNRAVVSDASARLVVCTAATLAQAGNICGPGASPVAADDLPEAPGADAEAAGAGQGPGDLAWILYTSGTTAAPKGVFQDRAGLCADLAQSIEDAGLGPADRMAMFYRPSVIAGLRVLLGGLLSGGSLHMLPPRDLGAARLAEQIDARGITVFRGSGALFRHVMTALPPGRRLESLRLVMLGGDHVHWSDYDLFRARCAEGARFGSHLSATECSTVYAQWLVDEDARGGGAGLPVGRPCGGRMVSLRDADGAPVPEGEPGAIFVTGRHLALGYWKAPEATAAAFSADPADPGLRTYRTGDLGRFRPDGLLEFSGRADDQIKLRGYRIEPGEIEGALRACSGVRDAAVVVRRDPAGTPVALSAYVQLQDGVKGLLPRHLMAIVAQRLPAHMVPAEIHLLDQLPWLANFKIDRRRLEEMDRRPRDAAPIDDPTTAAVAEVFGEVLQIDSMTPEDSLASLGGDSLQAVDITLALERRFGVRVPQRTFRASRSLRDLSGWIAAKLAARGGRRPPGTADAGT